MENKVGIVIHPADDTFIFAPIYAIEEETRLTE